MGRRPSVIGRLLRICIEMAAFPREIVLKRGHFNRNSHYETTVVAMGGELGLECTNVICTNGQNRSQLRRAKWRFTLVVCGTLNVHHMARVASRQVSDCMQRVSTMKASNACDINCMHTVR